MSGFGDAGEDQRWTALTLELEGGPFHRFPWAEFAPVVIAAEEGAVKRHPEYEAAKTGDVPAAKRLAASLASPQTTQAIRALLAGRRPMVVPVHALESQGYNRIPAAFAELLAERLDLEVEQGIVQANVVNHTGATGWERMVRPAAFDGQVTSGIDYLLVDDFVGQGGTLANLRGYLMHGSGRVLAATTLTGRADSATLALRACDFGCVERETWHINRKLVGRYLRLPLRLPHGK